MADLKLPTKLHDLLFQKQEFASDVISNLKDLLHVLENNNLYFFPEYTDHSIRHVESVLTSIENLMTDDTIKELTSTDVGVLVTAVVLHDIGMLTSAEMFKNMISGKYDNELNNWFEDEPTWKDLWRNYVKESQYWDSEKRKNVTGDSDYIIRTTDKDFDEETDKDTITYKISHSLGYTECDRRYIGEFIRRHHARLAYDVALKGYSGDKPQESKSNGLPRYFMQLAGLIARSHGMNVRDTYDILKDEFTEDSWNYPINIKVVLLMILIRIADYLQIDPERTDPIMLNLRTIYSPYSLMEHEMHRSIDCIQLKSNDPERIVVQATPKDAQMYIKIERLIQDIQHEFDLSWAILGEVYGNSYQLRYRRIVTNISDKKKIKKYNYVPKQFGYKFNNKLFELLIAPLYGDDPSFGVRELVQNAVDACRTRLAIDPNYCETTHVRVDLDTEKKLFTIEDTGIGMTIDEIENYFLTIGSSYDSSIEWKKTRDAEGIYRTGHFGIGILAAFLLGNRITIKTRSIKSKQGYMFTVSLQDSFIQINKIEKQNIGTIITVQCEVNSVEELTKDVLISQIVEKNDECASYWFNLYIDEVPRVCYYSDKVQITPHLNASRGFMKLKYQHDEFEVFWKPLSFYWEKWQNENYNSSLYCNGFFITDSPSKGSFNLNCSSYLDLHKIRIPALIIKDKYNMLPLNLKRDNIDSNYSYSFEKELAYEFLKDLICRLCASNVEDFNRNYLCFTANGFAINQYPSFPFIGDSSASLIKNDLYAENFLSNKKIVNIICTEKDAINKININEFRKIIKGFPEYVFYFYEERNIFDNHVSVIKYQINEWLYRQQFYCIVVDKSHSRHLSFQRFVSPLISNDNFRILKDDVFINLLEEYSDLLASILILFNNSNLSSPPYFLIKKNKKNLNPSEFDDFFNKYASGDLIIPYDEADRKIKFAKLYEECGEKIEQYKEVYNRHHKEGS